MITMRHRKQVLPVIIVALLFMTPCVAVAEEAFALHPLKGLPEEAVNGFFDVLINTLPELSSYAVWIINMNDLPSDVPPGGFPANVCPPPSLTGEARYAFTGEVGNDSEYPDHYRLRLYLWDMLEKRLIMSDELTSKNTAPDQQRMQLLLAWLLSWINPKTNMIAEYPGRGEYLEPEEPPKDTKIQEIQEVTVEKLVFKTIEEYWLYAGLRGGGGYSLWYSYFYDEIMEKDRDLTAGFWNINAALQFVFHPARFFEIQTEAAFNADFDSLDYINLSLTVPLLFKLVLHDNRLRTGIYGGVSLYIPLHKILKVGNENYATFSGYKPGFGEQPIGFPGFIFGLNLGWKLGNGYLFLDGRFDYDGLWMQDSRSDGIYYRNLVKISIGYEKGFFEKKKRGE